MSQAPLDLDLVTAAHTRLSEFAAFQELVEAGLIGTDADAAAPLAEKVSKAWLFQGLDDEGRPFRDPEGSGTSVIVLSERREWAGPNPHNTAYFPALQMLVYTDSARGTEGEILTRDADRKCKHIFRRLDRCFHLPSNQPEDRSWPGMPVYSSLRGAGFELGDVPGTNAATVRGEVVYHTITG